MSCWTRLFLTLCIVLSSTVLAAENQTCPLNWIFIDIHYRNVDARPDTFSYGLFIGAGVNSQNQSLWPAISHNETRLASNDFCGDSSPANCQDAKYTHGHFGPDSSASWDLTPQYQSSDSELIIDPELNITYGTDTLNLYTHYIDPSPASKTAVKQHPITLMSDDRSTEPVFFTSGSVGLGPSSTLIKQLVDSGQIGRNVFGLYLGTAYPRAGGVQNGSLVLGGYDAGRLAGEPHEYQMAVSPAPAVSPLKVHVNQLSLVTKDNQSIGLVTDDGFDGYISTEQYAMDLPDDITHLLMKVLSALPTNDEENVLQTSKAFDGNLTITLEDGYTISYPAEWISNASGRTPFSAPRNDSVNGSTTTASLVFGTSFLHHLYMTVDYDASKFFLADALIGENYVQPESLCVNALPLAAVEPKLNKFLQQGLVGAVLGGVIGGIALILLTLFCVRRILQKRQLEDRTTTKMNGQPLKSSLRSKARKRFVRFDKSSNSEISDSRTIKRVSFADSDSSSDKEVNVVVADKGIEGISGIEMTRVGSTRSYRTDSPVSGAGSLHEVPIFANRNDIRQTTIEMPLPTPNRFNDPYGPSPLGTPVETPQTGNPLLPSYTQAFSHIEDNDDSDLNPQFRPSHRRTPSEQARRIQLGLKIDTTMKPGKQATGTIRPKDGVQHHRPAPKPGKRQIKSNTVKTDADYVKTNPAKSLFGFGGGTQPHKSSALRKMFP